MNINQQGTLLKTYSVKYVSGLTGLHKTPKRISMQLYTEGFCFFGSDFPSLWIPHNSVVEFKISKDGLSHLKQTWLESLNERMIDIFYLNSNQEKFSIKVEMPPPLFVFLKFTTLEDLKATMKAHGIFDKFASAVAVNSSPDIMDQIGKLAELHKSGTLTDEEFQSKKSELLKRL